jgi:DDE superfamily endonuclease
VALFYTYLGSTPLGIELCYLPAYSPQLNLIERLWKFVRNECLYSKYYENFADFKAAISIWIGTANTERKENLDSLSVNCGNIFLFTQKPSREAGFE